MNVDKIIQFGRKVRLMSLKMVHEANSSHIGGAFSMTDILAVLYNGILNINPSDPFDENRDRFILSKGHACTSLYATLAYKNYFDINDLNNYAKDGSIYLSHTSHNIPGVEISAGSLGHGLPIAIGLAIAAKTKNQNWLTYCLVSDGEINEGSNWEGILLAPQLKLNNLVLIVDYNKIQSLGFVEDIIDLEPIVDKFLSFNWDVHRIDGHNYNELISTFNTIKNKRAKPTVVIADTIKGKGVDFMENKLLWHYKSPDISEYENACNQINSDDVPE